MTREDIDILLGLRDVVEENLDNDPVRVALDKRIPHAALVATQVKYLQRAAAKLPAFHAARCIIPPLSFEQASSQQAALHKAYSGDLAVDLACGLGVDAWAFSQRFERVVAVERDPVLAYLAEVNFRLLGATNITVVNASAEDFEIPADADLIYVDADRRSPDGRKLVLMEDCSPNVMELLPRMRAALRNAPEGGGRVVLKLSPMFDVDEALRIFGGRVEVVSSGGECKEVLVEMADPYCGSSSCSPPGAAASTPDERAEERADERADERAEERAGHQEGCGTTASSASTPDDRTISFGSEDPGRAADAPPHGTRIAATVLGFGTIEYADRERAARVPLPALNYLAAPDAALVKARLAARWFTEQGMYIEGDNSFAISAERPENVPGRVYRITRAEPYSPKTFGRHGMKRADIMVRDFPLTAARIAKALGLKEGGHEKLAFSRIDGKLHTLFLSPLT